MDEHRSRCRQGAGIGERLVGEEQAFVGANLKGLQAEAAGTVSGRQFGMGRVTVLGRLHGFPRGGGKGLRDASKAVEAHGPHWKGSHPA